MSISQGQCKYASFSYDVFDVYAAYLAAMWPLNLVAALVFLRLDYGTHHHHHHLFSHKETCTCIDNSIYMRELDDKVTSDADNNTEINISLVTY